MADTKISAMTAATELDRADLVAVVQDVATTPVNRSATLDVLDPGQTLGGTAVTDATAVGDSASAPVAGNVAVGPGAVADGTLSGSTERGGTAVGRNADAAILAVAVGFEAVAQNQEVLVGAGITKSTTAAQNTLVGYSVDVGNNSYSVVIGHGASSDRNAVVVGKSASSDRLSVAAGNVAVAGIEAVAVGAEATASHRGSVALGFDTDTTATDQVMVGPRDIEITGTDKGLVLEDRTLETRHRVYLDNGALEIEAA